MVVVGATEVVGGGAVVVVVGATEVVGGGAVVDEGSVLPIPAGLTLTEAAGIPEVFATAWLNLFIEAGVQPGEKVVLHAGASGVGTAAIQMCRINAVETFVTVGSEDKLNACLQLRLPKASGQPLQAMPTDEAWLASPTGFKAVPAAKYQGDPLKAAWFPNATVARGWMQYVKDTAVVDTTPPPAPTNLQVNGNQLSWQVEADLESGLARFIIQRDNRFLANFPEEGKNRFGRPLFQNLLYSDTPTQPLVPLQFTDSKAEPGKTYTYRVIAVNTVGLKSEPSAPAESVDKR